jgi:drug/metabolite transporter (DMT)-like permease
MPTPEPALAARDERMTSAIVVLLCGVVAISFGPIIIRVLGRAGGELGPISVGFWRMFLAALVLFPLTRLRRGRALPAERRPMTCRRASLLMLPGVGLGLDSLFWNCSIQLTTVSNATLLVNLTVLLVSLVGWLWLGERLRPLFVVGLVCALAGLFVFLGISGGGQRPVLGNVLGGLACVFYAGYILAVRVMRRTEGALDLMAWSSASGAVILFIGAIVMGEDMLTDTLVGWCLIAALAFGCHVLGQGLIMYSMSRVPASLASLFLLGQPLLATILAAWILTEGMTWLRGSAGLAVLAGIYIAQKGVLPPVEAQNESEEDRDADGIPVRQGIDNG